METVSSSTYQQQQHHTRSPSSVVSIVTPPTATTPTATMGIEKLGVDPKHPNVEDHHLYHTDPNLFHLMDDAKQCMEEWNTTVVPQIEPVVNHLLQRLIDIKSNTIHPPPPCYEKQHHYHDENHGKEVDGLSEQHQGLKREQQEIQMIHDQIIEIQDQVNKMYDQLHYYKVEIYHAIQIHPPMIEATKYLSPISKLSHFLGRTHNYKTQQQDVLDDYYNKHFLHQYETASIEYRNVVRDKCQYILQQCVQQLHHQ